MSKNKSSQPAVCCISLRDLPGILPETVKTRNMNTVFSDHPEASFIVEDMDGQKFRSFGESLKTNGYIVKCVDLCEFQKCNHYNPMQYIHSEEDIIPLVHALIEANATENTCVCDPFWGKSEQLLLNAVIAFVRFYCSEQEQTFSSVMKLLRSCEPCEDSCATALDKLFETQIENKECFAYRQYKAFKLASNKTANKVIVSVLSRLQVFDLENIVQLTENDDLDLEKLSNEKTALFICRASGGQNAFDCISAMLVMQARKEYMQHYSQKSSMKVYFVTEESSLPFFIRTV